jgi:hypothetical protein
MNCDAKSRGSSYTHVTHMLVPTHVSSCQSWCSCSPSRTKKFPALEDLNTWRFQHKLLFHNLHKVSWSGFDGGELLLWLLVLVIILHVFKLLLRVHVTPLPLLIIVLLCALSLLPWFCSSSWSYYSWWSWCHGLATHHGLVTCHGLVCVFALYVPSCDLCLYFVRPCSCRGHALLHQFFWEVYHIKYGFTLGEVDFFSHWSCSTWSGWG